MLQVLTVKFSVDSKHGGVKGHVIAALNFNIELD